MSLTWHVVEEPVNLGNWTIPAGAWECRRDEGAPVAYVVEDAEKYYASIVLERDGVWDGFDTHATLAGAQNAAEGEASRIYKVRS